MDANPNMDTKRKEREKKYEKDTCYPAGGGYAAGDERSRDGGDPDRKHYGYRN